MTALLAAAAVGLATMAIRPARVHPGRYLQATDSPGKPVSRRSYRPPPAMLWGGGAGAALATSTVPDRILPLVAVGGLAGLLVRRAISSTRADRRGRRLAQEVPAVADALALRTLAGDSVAGAIHGVIRRCRGVAAEELSAVLALEGGLEDALRQAARDSAHPSGARLWDLLAHAHRTGGRLAEALFSLATDLRATLAADLTAEGGRRALASYGPILAFMVPVTIVFLMYPTLAGLNALSARP